MYDGKIGSTALDTIRDITLLLWKKDPGGCTSSAPKDEYAHEAIHIYNAFCSKQSDDFSAEVVEFATTQLYAYFVGQFSADTIYEKNDQIWRDIVTESRKIYKDNIRWSLDNK